jgi:hypothetical protein
VQDRVPEAAGADLAGDRLKLRFPGSGEPRLVRRRYVGDVGLPEKPGHFLVPSLKVDLHLLEQTATIEGAVIWAGEFGQQGVCGALRAR